MTTGMKLNLKYPVILASASPRRRELLTQLGITFTVEPSDIEEVITAKLPGEVVKELAFQKAEDISKKHADSIVIGADTVVAIDDRILGKPGDVKEAREMIHMIQGRTHQVYTGVAVIRRAEGKIWTECFYEKTDVTVACMSEEEIENYIATPEPYDKAGAYGIQGIFAAYVSGIRGDYQNVVGLPVAGLYQVLKRIGKDYKVCIFDLDGTLADSVASIAYSANRAIGKFGFAPNPVENYKQYAGDGAAEMLKRSLLAAGDTKLAYYEQVQKEYKVLFAQDCMYQVKPYDGICEMLEGLKKKGLKIAVLSNKPHERAIDVVEALFGKGYFDTIVGQSDNRKRKPDPEGALYLADMFAVKPEECIYVGDTNTDMLTGNRADMFTVGVTWGFRGREELKEFGAHTIIDKPEELIDKLGESDD